MFQKWFQVYSTLKQWISFFTGASEQRSTLDKIGLGSITVIEVLLLAAFIIFGYALYTIVKTFKEPKVEPPKMYNNAMNFNVWINEVERFFDESKITSDKAKIDAVTNKLDAQSKSTIKELIQNKTIRSYKQLQEHLNSFYNNDVQTRTEHLINFAERLQLPDENLHQYYTAVSALARKAYPSEPEHIIANFTTEQFITGLYNTYIKLQLLERKNDKMNILTQALALQNKVGNAAYDLNPSMDTCHLRTIRTYSNSPNNRRYNIVNTQQPSNDRFNNRSSSNSTRNVVHFQDTSNPILQKRDLANHPQNRSNNTCYNCYQTGHFMQQCPKSPPRNERNPSASTALVPPI